MIERASEFGASAAVPLTSSDDVGDERSAGDMLRQAREAHGLDIAVVAAALKVPPQKIEALEDDDIDALPDPVFARALAASMSRALRLDPAPVLARLPGAPQRGFGPTQRPLGAAFNTEVQRGNGSPLSRTLWTVVALLLVAAAAVVFLPQSVFDRAGAMVSGLTHREADTSATGAAAVSDATPAVPAGQVVESVVPSSTVAAVPNPASVPAAASPAPAPAAPVVSGARPMQDAAAATANVPAAAKPDGSGDMLAFNAREDAWISVSDGTGKQLLRRLVKAGESVPLNGTPPLSVVVGRASAVDVQVHGKPFDLGAVAGSGGVARFEVKP